MNRRSFVAALAAALVLDPERLLWRPGKLISVPPPTRPAGPTCGAVVAMIQKRMDDALLEMHSRLSLYGEAIIKVGRPELALPNWNTDQYPTYSGYLQGLY